MRDEIEELFSIAARFVYSMGARPILRNPENKKLLTLLGYRFTLTSTMITVG
jgi:hypothetical protein